MSAHPVMESGFRPEIVEGYADSSVAFHFINPLQGRVEEWKDAYLLDPFHFSLL